LPFSEITKQPSKSKLPVVQDLKKLSKKKGKIAKSPE